MYIGLEQRSPYQTMLKAHMDHLRFGAHLERYRQIFGTAGSMLDAASLHVSSLNGTSPTPIHRVGTTDFQGIILPTYYATFPFSDRLIFNGIDGASIGYEMTQRQYGGATRVHVFEHGNDDSTRFSGWSIVKGNLLVESFDIGEDVTDTQALDWGLNMLEGITAAKMTLCGLENADIAIDPSPFVPAKQPRPVSRLRR